MKDEILVTRLHSGGGGGGRLIHGGEGGEEEGWKAGDGVRGSRDEGRKIRRWREKEEEEMGER